MVRSNRRTAPATVASPATLTPAVEAAIAQIPESVRGPLEAAIDRIMGSSAHLWHGRHGTVVGGKWAALKKKIPKMAERGADILRPGFFAPAAVALYQDLLIVYKTNPLLLAHLASWTLAESDWKDLKVALAALLLAQPEAMFREVGEAMVLAWDKKLGKRAFNAKQVLRVAEFLDHPEIFRLNVEAGFCSSTRRQAYRGRWTSAADRYLLVRERNPHLMDGLVKAGFRRTLAEISRKVGYRPETSTFFQRLRWEQHQPPGGHRTVAIGVAVEKRKDTFDGMSEEQICAKIRRDRLKYAEVVGRLPAGLGLTQAIMVALLPHMSDKDLIILSPTLEAMGLLEDKQVYAMWLRATQQATDQRALNVAKNVKSADLKDKLEEAGAVAVKKAVSEAVKDDKIRILFLIDISASQQGAVEKSKELVPRILTGLGGDGGERLHVASFNSVGTVIQIGGRRVSDIQKVLGMLRASGGTDHRLGVRALYNSGVRQASDETLIIFVVGDEAGEPGRELAEAIRQCGYRPAAFGLVVNLGSNVSMGRGQTVRDCAAHMRIPYSEVELSEFDDPYAVPRVLRRMIDAPTPDSQQQGQVVHAAPSVRRMGWIERVMSTPLLVPPIIPPKARRSEVV